MKLKVVSIGLLILTSIFCTGCVGKAKSGEQSLSNKTHEYKIEIIKSQVNKKDLQVTIVNKETTAKEILNKLGIEYELNKEKISKLDGVIATAAKSWNLYLNNQKQNQPLEVKISHQDKVEWRYE